MFSRWDPVLAALVFITALWVNVHAVPTTEFHRDEARWIYRGRFLEQLLHPTGSYWQDSELMQGQPPLGSYMTGLGLLLQGRDLDTNGFYDFHFSEGWNRRHGNLPEEVDLAAARQTNSVVGALTAASVYLIARALSNPVAGLAAAALLIPHPLAIYLSSLGGSDGLVSLLVAWSILAAMALAQRPTWPRAVALGVLLGLGGATKLSPLALTILLAAAGVVLIFHGWRVSRGGRPGAQRVPAGESIDPSRLPPPASIALGWRLLPQPAIATAVFILSYPYLWPDPIGRTIGLLRFRALEMYNQGVIWSELKVNGPVDALGRVGNWLGDVDSVTGQAVSAVASPLGFGWKPMGFDLVLAVIGALLLLVLAIHHGLGSRWGMAALTLGGQVALIVFGMRADFSRYLFLVLVATSICGGLVVGGVWDAARVRLARRFETRRPARKGATMAGEPVAT